jgi:hypothetical protein
MILTTPQKAALLKTSCNLNIISDFSQSFKVFEVLNINIEDNGILRRCAAQNDTEIKKRKAKIFTPLSETDC